MEIDFIKEKNIVSKKENILPFLKSKKGIGIIILIFLAITILTYIFGGTGDEAQVRKNVTGFMDSLISHDLGNASRYTVIGPIGKVIIDSTSNSLFRKNSEANKIKKALGAAVDLANLNYNIDDIKVLNSNNSEATITVYANKTLISHFKLILQKDNEGWLIHNFSLIH